MNAIQLLDLISTGETSTVQFKKEMPHRDSIQQEIVAMSNSSGGQILMGIEDVTGQPIGLNPEQIEEYDRVVAQIVDNVKPVVFIQTEVVKLVGTGDINILVITVPEGINKPYKTPKGEIYVKQGSNKRLVIDNAEIMRLYQQSSNLLADEMLVYGATISDINHNAFEEYFKKEFGVSIEDKGLTYKQALEAKRVIRNEQVTLAGLLFFGYSPQSYKPAFTIKLVDFFGTDISSNQYRSKPSDLIGTIPELFNQSLEWVKSHLHSVQDGQVFNSIGKLEISETALVEIIQNALVHRDYFKNSPIRIMIFDDRLEIVSPGKLPNTLTIEDIKYGNPVIRNNQLVSYSTHALPFSGLGSGIKRSLAAEPSMELYNDVEGEQFKVVFKRK